MKRYFKIVVVVLIVVMLFGGAASLKSHKVNAADSIDRETFFERVSDYMGLYSHGKNCLNESFYSDSGSYLGQTCQGYAHKMTDFVFSSECRNGYASGWIRYNASSGDSQIDRLSIGDMVRYRAASYCDHTIFVTAMYGEYIEYTDCNSDNAGTVKWNQITTRDALSEKLKKKLVYDPGYYGWIAHYTGSPFTPESRVPVANARQVILFEHINYEGAYRVLEIGTYYNPAAMGFGNDSLSSVKVGSEVKVKLGEHDNFSGRTQTYYSDVSSLVGTYIGNDTVSSVKVSLK